MRAAERRGAPALLKREVETAMSDREPGPPPEGERVVERFLADRAVYIRDHTWMAALGMVGAMGVLYLMGNPDFWVGAPAALLAIAVRGAYLASEALSDRWDLTERRLLGPAGRDILLDNIAAVRRLGSAVQIVTKTGDKHLMKYMADAAAVQARLERRR